MKLSELKNKLESLQEIKFELPNGTFVPNHFHVTEVGKVSKHFIDCGGKLRTEEKINFQLWNANDYDHRLHPEKLIQIIELAEEALQLHDLEIEVEFQGETIQTFGLAFHNNHFSLTTKQTACLAEDACGIPPSEEKPKISLSTLSNSSCEPGSGCC